VERISDSVFGILVVGFIGPVIIAVLLGEWLQNKYDIEDWVYLAIISLAFLASVYGLIMEGKKAVKNMESMEIKEKEENKEKNNKILFSIKDTGIGISSEEQVVLFEKFSRGRDVGKLHTEGVGLGLYLGAKMVKAHNGKIWVKSEGENKGSTFYFELPLKK